MQAVHERKTGKSSGPSDALLELNAASEVEGFK